MCIKDNADKGGSTQTIRLLMDTNAHIELFSKMNCNTWLVDFCFHHSDDEVSLSTSEQNLVSRISLITAAGRVYFKTSH